MYLVLAGCILTASLVISLFFLKFWVRTGDRLFALFATAFGFLAIERLCISLQAHPNEASPKIYVLRLIAFLLILGAIADKNRQGGGARKSGKRTNS